MEEIGSYLNLARSMSLAEFVARSAPAFLVKRPRKRVLSSPAPVTISYETQLTKLDLDPYADEWRVLAVKKREGNPYPDRISVGRAPNCDVVIRLPMISKVHAHILVQGAGSYGLADNGASNATFVNGRKLEAKKVMDLRVGDQVAFGSLEVEFVDTERLYGILRSELLRP
jgi:hypothetical protein